jgi:hypothetical protein
MSSLPKIDQPIYNIKVPSLNKNIKFRPFLVKEEKLLLMAKESDNESDILGAIKQIVNNCNLDKNFNIDKIALFDLEYIFLKLRAFSVNNIVKVSYKDYEDEKVYDFDIDLNEIEVIFPEKVSNNIKITEKSGIVMSYPSASLYEDKEFLGLNDNFMFELILRCIDKIYVEDEIYEPSNYSKSDLNEFLENLSLKVFEDIQNFLLSVPKIEYKIKYKNSFGNDRLITLSSLNDFFSWR